MMSRAKTKPRVLVAMSGGVDSSVAAYILCQAGYEVIGVTIEMWSPAVWEGRDMGCCSQGAVSDARRVAEMLGIPHCVVNFREQFARQVIDYFVEEYLRGRTPNPCVACNRYIKFALLLERARALGADYLATGHYARIGYARERKRYLLLRASDLEKDQTYVLYTLTQDQLARIMFPLGRLTKREVRKTAREAGLPVAEKPESQEICFIPQGDYRWFISRYVAERKGRLEPGPILDRQGRVLGRHRGLAYYTIGQRRGLGLASGKRLYVVELDPRRNAVVVGEEPDLLNRRLISSGNNIIAWESLERRLEVEAKIRYTSAAAPAFIEPRPAGRVLVEFAEPQRAITPGQAVVFYEGEVVVGGGTIEKVLPGHPDTGVNKFPHPPTFT